MAKVGLAMNIFLGLSFVFLFTFYGFLLKGSFPAAYLFFILTLAALPGAVIRAEDKRYRHLRLIK